MHLCCVCAEKVRKIESERDSSTTFEQSEEIPPVKTAFVKIKKSGDERDCNFHYEQILVPEHYKYYCSDCAVVKLLRDPSIKESDHDFVSERVRDEEPCENYRLWLQFTATIAEMLRRKQHYMAQYSLIISSRETYVNNLEQFVKNHIPLPFNLLDYKNDRAGLQKYTDATFRFHQYPRRATEDREMIEMLRGRPIIDEDEEFIQISQMLVAKKGMETIPLSPGAFAYFFFKSEMELIMELALQKCTDKIRDWDKAVDRWIGKRNRYFSVLSKEPETASKHYLKTKHELFDEARMMHRDKSCEKIHVPFHFDSGYMKRTHVKPWRKVSLADLKSTFKEQVARVWTKNTVDLDRMDAKFKIKTTSLSAEELEKKSFHVKSGTLKNREWHLPVVSFPVREGGSTAGFVRESISNMLDYTITQSGHPMKKLELTKDWQLGIAMVGFNTRNVQMKMATTYYRVAVKLFKSEDASAGVLSRASSEKKILMWCLDLDKQNIFWVKKVPTVYKLPAHCGPTVIPFQAHHVWYTSVPRSDLSSELKYTCRVEEYLRKSLESWHASSTKNQINTFIEKHMNFRGNYEIKVLHSRRSKCPIERAMFNFGDIIVRDPHGEKQVTMATWWSEIQQKHAVVRNPGAHHESATNNSKRKRLLCAFSNSVMLHRDSAICHRPVVNTLKQYDLCEEYKEAKEKEYRGERLTREAQMIWRAVNKYPSYRRVMRILLKYLNENEKTRDYQAMFMEVMSLKQVEAASGSKQNSDYPERFPKVTKSELMEFLSINRALSNDFPMPCDLLGNTVTAIRAFDLKREKDEDKKNFYPTILMNMLNGLKILDNSIFFNHGRNGERTVGRRNIRLTYRKAYNANTGFNYRNRRKGNNNYQQFDRKSDPSNTENQTITEVDTMTEEEKEKQARKQKFIKDDFKQIQMGNKWLVQVNGIMYDMKQSEEYLRERRAALASDEKKKDHVVISKEDLEAEEAEETSQQQLASMEFSTILLKQAQEDSKDSKV